MTRPRGGYIGFNRVPAASALNSAASGVWTLREAESLKRAGTWPLPIQTVLLLNMDGTGQTFLDASSNPKAVAASGNATQSSTESKFGGKSAFFDGTGDYLTLTDSENDFAFGAGDFTYEWWFKSSSSTAYAAMMTRPYTSPGGILISLNGSSGNGRPEIFWREYADALFLQSSQGGFNDNAWHHFAFVRTGTTCYMFIDGVIQATKTDVSTSIPSSTIYISSDRVFASRDYAGYIDDFRISKGARYNAAFTPPSSAHSN
jgi:hypothetical protein